MVGLDRPCIVDALQHSSITVYKTWVWGISDSKVNLRPPFLMVIPYHMTALISVNRWCSEIEFWCLFLCHSRHGDDPWQGEHQRYPSSHNLVLLCHKAALNLQHTEQIGALSHQQAVGHIHISYQFPSPNLNCMSSIAWAWPGTCCCHQMRTSISSDVSYILFIALGLT